MSLQSGTRLGPYEIVAPIGAGGMGEVYKATDTRLNRTVAIKVLPAALSRRSRHEAALRARSADHRRAEPSEHLHAATTSAGEGDIDFLVMEYLEGDTLAGAARARAAAADEALKVAIAIADALDKAHGQGVMHRDLKPGNSC